MAETKRTGEQDREHIEFARTIQNKVVQSLVSIIDRLEAEKAEDDIAWAIIKAEKAELVEVFKELLTWIKTVVLPRLVPNEKTRLLVIKLEAAIAKASPSTNPNPEVK